MTTYIILSQFSPEAFARPKHFKYFSLHSLMNA